MGYVKLPSRKTIEVKIMILVILGYPIIGKTMTSKRFDEILSNLHVNGNMKIIQDNKDRDYKFRPMIDK